MEFIAIQETFTSKLVRGVNRKLGKETPVVAHRPEYEIYTAKNRQPAKVAYNEYASTQAGFRSMRVRFEFVQSNGK